MNPYSFGILEPVMQVLKEKKYEYIWFVRTAILRNFHTKINAIQLKLKI
jgi:hypothetical protein